MAEILTQAPHGHQRGSYKNDASVVFIGIQGVGKRTLAFIAAAHLRRRLVSEKFFFEEQNGMTKSDYLDKHGEEAFQCRHFETVRQMLQRNSTGCVIECGTASVTKQVQALLRDFSQTNPVIHVVRCAELLAAILKLGPKYVDQLEAIYAQQRNCSNLEFYNLYDDTETAELNRNGNSGVSVAVQWLSTDVKNYIDRVFDQVGNSDLSPFSVQFARPEQKPRSTCLVMLLSAMITDNVEREDLALGQDAIELCVDVWPYNFKTEISKRVGWIRRNYDVPIILSVEQRDGGASKQNPEIVWETLNHGLHLLVEYIAVGEFLSQAHHEALLACKGQTRAILDLHYPIYQPGGWLCEDRYMAYREAKDCGFDIVRMTQVAQHHRDNQDLQLFVHRATESKGPPLIAYNTGHFGRTSQVSNRILTPVGRLQGHTSTHDLSIRDIVSALFSLYEFDSLHFHIFGQSVSASKTPIIYRSAFSYYGLQHTSTHKNFRIFQETRQLTTDAFFGGAAISFPFKEEAFKSCISSSIHAAAIGSVNTLIPLRRFPDANEDDLCKQANARNTAGEVIGFHGENTDWAAIHANVRRKLSPRNLAQRNELVGLVLGAGGSARSAVYALLQLGCHSVCIKNRTQSRAVSVAHHFNAWATANGRSPDTVRILDNNDPGWPANIALPTVIVCCIPPIATLFSHEAGEFDMPDKWLSHPPAGVVCDVSYVPTTNTPFLKHVERFRKTTGRPWEVINGLDVIYEQGILQFEHLIGFRAPADTIRQALLDSSQATQIH